MEEGAEMNEMRISSFGSQEDGYVELDEPLVFQWEHDRTGYFVIRGTGDYGHVMDLWRHPVGGDTGAKEERAACPVGVCAAGRRP